MDSKLENNEGRPILDIEALRGIAIERISQLSGSIWTDYNATDPGITIIEALCFSILDLGYRMTFDIRDLLTEEGQRYPLYEDTFHEPQLVLPSAPLTIDDYRKLILENVDGIMNVWLKATSKTISVPKDAGGGEKEIKGFYDVLAFLDEQADENEKEKEIKAFLDKNRNLCEDFNTPKIIKPLSVGIEAAIEVEPEADYESILQTIIGELTEYVSPQPHFYSMDEMLQKGKTVSEVFTGPFPKKGFVDMDEIEGLEDNHTLYVSDAIGIIMQIKGVKGVRHLRFFVGSLDSGDVSIESHKISLKESTENLRVFRFAEGNADKSKMSNKIDFLLNDFKFTIHAKRLEPLNSPKEKNLAPKKVFEFEKDQSTNRTLDKYYSFQHSMPDVYMVGKENVADSESDLRKAQRLQLKGFLVFFDQLLADFLMRLDSAKHVLSWEKSRDLDEWKQRQQTYLHRILKDEDVDDLDSVVDADYKTWFEKDVFDVQAELKQKNKALNALLARFGEEFVDYSIVQYISQSESGASREEMGYELVCSKSTMLGHLPMLGYRRAGAIDYHSELGLDETYKGNGIYDGNYYPIERKLAIKFGLKNYAPQKHLHPEVIRVVGNTTGTKKLVFADNRNTDYHETFGLHVYEHVLLLKGDSRTFLRQYEKQGDKEYENGSRKLVEDPYSMKVTVVLPGWLNVTQNHQFRDVVESVIAEEFPAHIAVKICWIDPLQMKNLEESHEAFLKYLRNETDDAQVVASFAENLSHLRNSYLETYTLDSKGEKINGTLLGYASLNSDQYQWDNNEN